MIYAVWLEDEKKNNKVIESCKERKADRVSSKTQHDIAWKLLEHVLNKEYSLKLSECTIERNRWGKPSFKKYTDIHFSISHNKAMAVCIISDKEVGIDIETVGRACSENVWRRMLSGCEYQGLNCMLDESERNREFLKYWTLKECYGKVIGTGLSYDYKSVTFDISDTGIVCSVPDYRLWQTVIKKNDAEIIVSVCKKQTEAFCESIEWVKLTGGEEDEA